VSTYQPRWEYTHPLVNDLLVIEAAREFAEFVPLPPVADLVLRQRARVRSTHASTAIEGNPIPRDDVPATVLTPQARATTAQHEVRNYWRALEWLEERAEAGDVPTEAFIRRLHALILPSGVGRPRQLSEYRTQQVVVQDAQRGTLEYMGPEWEDVPDLMAALAAWAVSGAARELPVVLRAGILAYQFVTIHPFMDGNGRTARALATFELWRSGYAFRGYMAMEDYYAPWLTYFAHAMRQSAEEVRRQSTRWEGQRVEGYALPRLSRRQQHLLVRCLNRSLTHPDEPLTFTPGDIMDWFGVSDRTARDWLDEWRDAGVVIPASGEARIRRWALAEPLQRMVAEAREAGITEPGPQQ